MGEGARNKERSLGESKGKTTAEIQGDTTFMPDFKFPEGRHRVHLQHPVHPAHRGSQEMPAELIHFSALAAST